MKKISLTEFKGIQMSVESLSKLKGGCGSCMTSTSGSATSSCSTDKDSGCNDWD